MKKRFSELLIKDDHTLTHVLVRSASGAGYWGRGATVEEAIAQATWFRSQSDVYVMQCDDKAHCNNVTGDIMSVCRGPIYSGKVMANLRDVMVSAEERPAKPFKEDVR